MSEAPRKEVSAIGYSITAAIDERRQIVFQHFIAADASDAEVNADLDRIMRLVDRQRAMYELPEKQAELNKLKDEISQFTEDKTVHAEANFQKSQADLDMQIATLQADRKKIYDDAYDAHRRSGRQSAFEPKGHVKNALDRADAGIAQAIEAKGKNEAERDFYVQNIDGNIQRRRDRIALLEGEIAELEKKVT